MKDDLVIDRDVTLNLNKNILSFYYNDNGEIHVTSGDVEIRNGTIFCNSNDELTKLNRDPMLEDLRNREVLLYQDPKMFPYFETLKSVNCKIGPQMWWEETMMLALASKTDSIALRPRHMATKSAFITQGQISVLPPITDFSMPVNLLFIYPSQDRLAPTEELFMDEFKDFFPNFEVQD